MSAKYVVAYAKISIDRSEGIALLGVYFGGIGETNAEAESIARQCVNHVKGGTILPKILQMEDENELINVLDEIEGRFEIIVKQMQEADIAMNRKR